MNRLDVAYQTISPNTVKIRKHTEWIEDILSSVILIILFSCTAIFDWWHWLQYIWIGLLVVTWISLVWNLLIGFPLYYKNFRYAINDEFIYIKTGIWFKKEFMIPMTKIQSIETSQGPLMKKYRVRSVEVKTINGQHVIPHLEEDVALNVREQISKLAQLKELDES